MNRLLPDVPSNFFWGSKWDKVSVDLKPPWKVWNSSNQPLIKYKGFTLYATVYSLHSIHMDSLKKKKKRLHFDISLFKTPQGFSKSLRIIFEKKYPHHGLLDPSVPGLPFLERWRISYHFCTAHLTPFILASLLGLEPAEKLLSSVLVLLVPLPVRFLSIYSAHQVYTLFKFHHIRRIILGILVVAQR